MSTTVIEATPTALKFPRHEFDPTPHREATFALRISGPDDKAGILAVHNQRMKLVKLRTGTDKALKTLLAPKQAEIAELKAVAAEIQALIAPMEQHCIDLEAAVELQIKAEEEKKRQALLEARQKEWSAAGCGPAAPAYLLHFTDLSFAEHIKQESARKAERDAEKKRQEEQAEANRLAAEEIAKQQAEFKAYQAKLAAERDALRGRMNLFAAVQYFPDTDEVSRMSEPQFAAALDSAREIFLEKQAKDKAFADALAQRQAEIDAAEAAARKAKEKQEAEERFKAETEKRLRFEREETERREKAEAERLAKEAAAKPAREKLAAYRAAVVAVVCPSIDPATDAKLRRALGALSAAVGKIADEIEVVA